jgi:hypothetical protein
LGARKINERHGSLRQRIVAEHRSVSGAHRDEHRGNTAREILSGLCDEVTIQHRVPAYKPIALVVLAVERYDYDVSRWTHPAAAADFALSSARRIRVFSGGGDKSSATNCRWSADASTISPAAGS